jgi:hypothetical protein
MTQVELPDRKEITLCEAVTAFVFGKPSRRRFEGLLNEEQVAKAKEVLDRLRKAAYAGQIKFRAIKEYADPADGYEEIDPLYFSSETYFNWPADIIFLEHNDSSPPWYFVHLDRENFVSLLLDIGASVKHTPETDLQGKQKTFESGVAGRPTSIHLVLPLARSRLDAGDYPDTFREFSEQLAEALAKNEPNAHRMTPKAIRNNRELRELWRRKRPK